MSEFKVGDKIESVTDTSIDIDIGSVYIVTEVWDDTVRFMDDAGLKRTRLSEGYKLHTSAVPPETITHEGYTYTRGERVRPEWLKDGAWVVNKISGVIAKLSAATVGFNVDYLSKISYNFSATDVYERFRPFTNEDWKWGMWAEYRGEKVFVMSSKDGGGVFASMPTNTYFFAFFSELTPTTAH